MDRTGGFYPLNEGSIPSPDTIYNRASAHKGRAIEIQRFVAYKSTYATRCVD